MRIKFLDWPFSENEVVTIHWIGSPKLNNRGEKICEVYFRRENGTIKSIPVGWGCLPSLWIGRKFANRRHVEDSSSVRDISLLTSEICNVRYGQARKIIPRSVYALKIYPIFRERCCAFEYDGYTYYIPCIELARVFLAGTSTLANHLISTGGLEDLINLSSWQADGQTAAFMFQEKTPGISEKLAKYFATIYGTPELHRIWDNTYIRYVGSGLIKTEIPSFAHIKLSFTEKADSKQRFVYTAKCTNITNLFRKVLYGPATRVRSGKNPARKVLLKVNFLQIMVSWMRRVHLQNERGLQSQKHP